MAIIFVLRHRQLLRCVVQGVASQSNDLHSHRRFTSAGELATVPIDVVKVRMQLQGELGSAVKYKSSLSAFPTIVREEGFLALYKGGRQPAVLQPAACRAPFVSA